MDMQTYYAKVRAGIRTRGAELRRIPFTAWDLTIMTYILFLTEYSNDLVMGQDFSPAGVAEWDALEGERDRAQAMLSDDGAEALDGLMDIAG